MFGSDRMGTEKVYTTVQTSAKQSHSPCSKIMSPQLLKINLGRFTFFKTQLGVQLAFVEEQTFKNIYIALVSGG